MHSAFRDCAPPVTPEYDIPAPAVEQFSFRFPNAFFCTRSPRDHRVYFRDSAAVVVESLSDKSAGERCILLLTTYVTGRREQSEMRAQ